jgi:hypothetical protein
VHDLSNCRLLFMGAAAQRVERFEARAETSQTRGDHIPDDVAQKIRSKLDSYWKNLSSKNILIAL